MTLSFRYMLGGAEPVRLDADTPEAALALAALQPKVRSVIGDAEPRIEDLQVVRNGGWVWVR